MMQQQSASFDNGAVLCQVCGDRASGFHYGVHACEGCKGFFRRSIQQKIQYRPCAKNQQCSILRINRNRCQYCRLKKCIAVGMSRDAVRFGRVPKKEKEKIRLEMQRANSRSAAEALAVELSDDAQLVAAVAGAHLRTSAFTRDKLSSTLHELFTSAGANGPAAVACPLSPSSSGDGAAAGGTFAERYSPAIRGVVDFAKSIPGFHHLPLDDQATLLKAGMFEVLMLRLCVLFDTEHKMVTLLDGRTYRRDGTAVAASKFLVDSTFDFIERFKKLCLNDMDVAMYCAVILVSPDRPGVRQVDLVAQLSDRLHACLRNVLAANHPTQPELYAALAARLPDLRTLNTLHQEKLLAFTLPSGSHMAHGAAGGSPSSGSTRTTRSPAWSESMANDEQQQVAAQLATAQCHSAAAVPSLHQLHLSPSADSGRATLSAQTSLMSNVDEAHAMSASIRQCMPTLAKALQAPPIVSLQQLQQVYGHGAKGFNLISPAMGMFAQPAPPLSTQYAGVPQQLADVKPEVKPPPARHSPKRPAPAGQNDELQPLNLSTKQQRATPVYVG